tara:strand:- start:5152 stop:5865 length:714 start_codon:yes stop_codon:yes gene_type:complete
MNKIKKKLIQKGWSVIKCKNYKDAENISKVFLNELKKNKKLKSLLRKRKVKNIDDLRKFSNTVDDKTLNFMKKIYLNTCSEKILRSFASVLVPIFGKKLFVQKHPQIQFHRGFSTSRITSPHNEMMAAHSPFTYNIWFPFHDIFENFGLYVIDDRLSVKLCDVELKKKINSREDLIKKYQFFPKIKFGEAIIFNAFVYHGAQFHKNKKARISLDVRFIRFDKPFLERYTDFFKKIYL